MATKHKKKLVCVGWGIYLTGEHVKRPLSYMTVRDTETKTIRAFNRLAKETGYPLYGELKRKGLAIAKKLWVKVNDEEA